MLKHHWVRSGVHVRQSACLHGFRALIEDNDTSSSQGCSRSTAPEHKTGMESNCNDLWIYCQSCKMPGMTLGRTHSLARAFLFTSTPGCFTSHVLYRELPLVRIMDFLFVEWGVRHSVVTWLRSTGIFCACAGPSECSLHNSPQDVIGTTSAG